MRRTWQKLQLRLLTGNPPVAGEGVLFLPIQDINRDLLQVPVGGGPRVVVAHSYGVNLWAHKGNISHDSLASDTATRDLLVRLKVGGQMF